MAGDVLDRNAPANAVAGGSDLDWIVVRPAAWFGAVGWWRDQPLV